jgi:hypothetical protein
MNVIFQFSIAGPGGGDWHVVVKDGECAVEAGAHGSPTPTLAWFLTPEWVSTAGRPS